MAEDERIGEAHLRHIIESAMDAIVTTDASQRIVLFNPAAQRMFHCTDQEALGQPIDRFIPERFRRPHQEQMQTFGRTRVTNRRMGALNTVIGLRADGTEFPAEVSISQFDTAAGKFFTAILRDITERRRLEEHLLRAERLAELGTLASGMAHEIGTPMNVILGRAEYLMRRTEEEATKKGLATIVAQVERITKIMNQLLTFARRRPIERRPIDLRRVVESCLEVVEDRLRHQRIKILTSWGQPNCLVQADPDQMSQVLLNLIINAIHAMPEGGTLSIDLHHADEQATIALTDTGHGISPELLSKIFDPFFTTKDVGQGTGLGLTVAHGIMQEHGGSITVSSQPNQGATFTLSLPIHQQ